MSLAVHSTVSPCDAVIRREIDAHGGCIGFERFMQLALFHAEHGYYMSRREKFGARGDFITAPGLGSLFAQCLAKQATEILAQLDAPEMLEAGPGDARLALDLLLQLEAARRLPARYWLLETSPELRRQQRARFEKHAPHLLARLAWRDDFPPEFCGVAFANEMLDAMPVKRFCINSDARAHELGVTFAQGAYHWREMSRLPDALCQRLRAFDLPPGYASEINACAEDWTRDAAGKIAKGALLLFDYGFPAHEFYHAERSGGTLMCHHQHRTHADVFFQPGMQDLSAHINFTAIAEAGEQGGMQLAGYASQAGFLLGCGALDLLQAAARDADAREQIALAQQMKTLTLPHEMGELFKAMAFTRGVRAQSGFGVQNRAGRL